MSTPATPGTPDDATVPAGLPRRTALHEEHVGLGATLTDFAGWAMPLRYSSDLAEHHAVRAAAGLFDLSHMGEIRVSGPAAGAALDRALVGALAGLGVGRARYTMLCAEDGGVLDDLVVYRTDDEAFLVVANSSNADLVARELVARCAGPDVGVEDESAGTALVAVQGPLAVDVVAGLVDDPAERDAVVGLRYYAATTAWLRTDAAPVAALVARTGYTGEDGFELFVAVDDAVALWRALLGAGGPAGLVPAGLACRDSLRLEAGMPLHGHELHAGTTPFEAGLGRVVRLDKTGPDGAPVEFVGRAALERRAEQPDDAPGARRLAGLQGLSRRAARPGYAVVGPDGDVVGEVTSGGPSPTLGHPVALAYVRPDLAEPGTELAVDVRGRPEPVRVVPLPFYRRPGR